MIERALRRHRHLNIDNTAVSASATMERVGAIWTTFARQSCLRRRSSVAEALVKTSPPRLPTPAAFEADRHRFCSR